MRERDDKKEKESGVASSSSFLQLSSVCIAVAPLNASRTQIVEILLWWKEDGTRKEQERRQNKRKTILLLRLSLSLSLLFYSFPVPSLLRPEEELVRGCKHVSLLSSVPAAFLTNGKNTCDACSARERVLLLT